MSAGHLRSSMPAGAEGSPAEDPELQGDRRDAVVRELEARGATIRTDCTVETILLSIIFEIFITLFVGQQKNEEKIDDEIYGSAFDATNQR